MTKTQKETAKVMYIVEPDELQQLIVEAVGQAMAEWQTTSTPQAEGAELMTRDEVCQFLSVTKTTLHNWHKQGYLTSIHIGRGVRYLRDDVEAFLKNKRK